MWGLLELEDWMKKKVRMLWITDKGPTLHYIYDCSTTMAELIKTLGWDSGPGCAMSSKETRCIVLTYDGEYDTVEPHC